MKVNFKNQLVKDLAWVIRSPGLLNSFESDFNVLIVSDDWFNQEYKRHLNWLIKLDESPSDIERFFEIPYRLILGKYAEALLHYFFLKSPFYRLLAHSLQIKRENIVIGELDFLVQCLESKKVFHIEFAIKFFLNQIKNNSNPRYFLGPNGRDDLYSKIQRLKKQLNKNNLFQLESIMKQNGFSNPIPTLITKGYLFYKSLTSQTPFFTGIYHNKGLYFKEPDLNFAGTYEGCYIYILPKIEWLSEVFIEPNDKRYSEVKTINKFSFYETLNLLGRSFMVSILEKDSNDNFFEIQRAFIVKNTWPKS